MADVPGPPSPWTPPAAVTAAHGIGVLAVHIREPRAREGGRVPFTIGGDVAEANAADVRHEGGRDDQRTVANIVAWVPADSSPRRAPSGDDFDQRTWLRPENDCVLFSGWKLNGAVEPRCSSAVQPGRASACYRSSPRGEIPLCSVDALPSQHTRPFIPHPSQDKARRMYPLPRSIVVPTTSL